MASVTVGKKVPAFSLPATGGKQWKLADVAGKNLVLYFYPKDMTSGCTLESQNFRDLHAAFRKAGTVVMGISRDSIASHDRFRAKDKLPFDLLSDEEEKVCKLFDVIQQKSMYGRKYMGVVRTTYLIAPDGKIAHRWDKVKVDGHTAEVLAKIDELAR